MAVFKRVDDQQVYTLNVYDADAVEGTYKVGDVIGKNADTDEISKISSFADAKLAKDDGLEIYLIAQSDAVTYKTGTPYKTYDVEREVVVSTQQNDKSLLAAYRVDNIDNIQF